MQMHSLVMLPLLLSGAMPPDKFWLDEAAADAAESSPRVITGVLLDQDEHAYHVRVEGGEVWLPKQLVVKLEQDGLTVAAVEQAEQDAAAARAAAAAAAPPSPADASAVPADAVSRREGGAAVEATAPIETASTEAVADDGGVFDPVVGVVRSGTAANRAARMRDLELAYRLTRDRSYLKELRKLRRYR